MLCSRCGAPVSGDGCKACGPGEPPARRARKRLPLRGLSGGRSPTNWTLLGLSLLAAVSLTSGFVWFLSESSDAKLRSQGIFDDEVVIAPGKQFGYILVAAVSTSFQFEVKPLDGSAVMAFGNVEDGGSDQMSPGDLESVIGSAVAVEAGKTGRKTGEVQRGRFLWIVVNPSKEKRLRVRIRFG